MVEVDMSSERDVLMFLIGDVVVVIIEKMNVE